MSFPLVYKSDSGAWRCVDCSLNGGRESYATLLPGEMLEHLMMHQRAHETVPEKTINALLREFWEARRER